MKPKKTSSKKAKIPQKGRKGGKSQRPDFIDQDFINPLESSPQIFSSDLLR
jgi:hypothetical protein